MSIGSLCTGIGGFDIGLEAAGLGAVQWMAEIDPQARAVLSQLWPGVRLFNDVHEVRDVRRVHVMCGGIPCQKLSTANVRTRARDVREAVDERAAGDVWDGYIRLVSEFRPNVVLVENTGRNWDRWVPAVRSDLYARGYSSVCVCVSPFDLDGPHHRDRAFVLAYPHSQSESLRAVHATVARLCADARRAGGPWREPFAGPVRLDDGIRRGMDALRLFGNAVSPPVAYVIGRAVIETWPSVLERFVA